MGIDKVVDYFKRQLYKALRALLCSDVHQDTEEAIAALQVVTDGVVDWGKFGTLIDLLTRNFVKAGLFTVLVKEEEEFYNVLLVPNNQGKIKTNQLLIKYEKAMLIADFAMIGKNFPDIDSNQSLKDMLTMDFVRTFYHELKWE